MPLNGPSILYLGQSKLNLKTGTLHLHQFLQNAIFYLHHKVIFYLQLADSYICSILKLVNNL